MEMANINRNSLEELSAATILLQLGSTAVPSESSCWIRRQDALCSGLDHGEILSQSRGWNDCNITAGIDRFWAIRGDGYLGEFVLENDKPTLKRGEWIQRDRVWSAAVVIGNRALVRGRRSLRHFDLSSLPVSESSPPGTDVTAMDAMYGNHQRSLPRCWRRPRRSPRPFSGKTTKR